MVKSSLPRLAISTIFASYLYVFMEWLFYVTKPSFFDAIGLGGKLSILFKTSLLLSLFGCAALFFASLIGWMLLRFLPKLKVQFLAAAIPAWILAALALLTVDNFTYTLFKVGIITTSGVGRGIYATLLLLTFLFICRWLSAKVTSEGWFKDHFLGQLSFILIIISVGLVLTDHSTTAVVGNDLQDANRLPNIIILGGDGINASHVSAYGYFRETTPIINTLAKESLFAENAFTNAGNSSGSTTAILTGRNATTTRVLYPPDILTGVDAFQHLPGILRQQGYYTAQLGVAQFIDAYNLNFQDAFDEVNGNTIQGTVVLHLFKPLGYDVAYFSSKVYKRITDRLMHIFYIRTMKYVFGAIMEPTPESNDDNAKVAHLLDLISNTNQPLFVHIHTMGTHGPTFFPREQIFSKGEEQNDLWMEDFYDDGILTFDSYVGEVLDRLATTGKLDNTILVIYSDHNQQYLTNQQVPLLIRFPKGEYTNVIQNNVQNIDIAPTLLDYMGLPIPDWMEGQSLLKGEPDASRLIFSTGAAYIKEIKGIFMVDPEQRKPPFYQLGFLGIVDCQTWYRYDLVHHVWSSGLILEQTTPCQKNQLLSPGQISDALLTHLAQRGYDISLLQNEIGIPDSATSP